MTELYSTKTLHFSDASDQNFKKMFRNYLTRMWKIVFGLLYAVMRRFSSPRLALNYNILYCFRYLISFKDVQAGHQITKSHSNANEEEKDINFWKLEERIKSSANWSKAEGILGSVWNDKVTQKTIRYNCWVVFLIIRYQPNY